MSQKALNENFNQLNILNMREKSILQTLFM